MMEDPIPIPGSFLTDVDGPVRPTVTQARPSLYIPPPSPSAASSLSNTFLCSGISHTSEGSRKRARYDSSFTNIRQKPQDDSDPDQAWAVSTTSLDSLRSPTPLVSTDYRLAGGLDTPTATTASIFADGQDSAVIDYRPSRFPPQTGPSVDGYLPFTPDVLSRERNGRKRAPPSPQHQGWGKAVCSIVGEVAGRVFNFCWTGAFRGFYAGGGRGYTMDTSTPTMVEKSASIDPKEKGDVFNQHYRNGTPIPGEFPAEESTGDYIPRPPSRHCQDFSMPSGMGGKRAGGKIQSPEAWVIVRSFEANSRETSPTRKIARTSTFDQSRRASRGATAARPRHAPPRPSRCSFAGSPALATGKHASFASPRRQIEMRSAEPQPHTPEGRHRSSQSSVVSSVASPRWSGNVRPGHTTPTSPEVQRFERRLRQKERANQDSIERLNQQTRDMIREAREALGTRIDIEDEVEMEDEGYGEGTELMGESKW